MSNYRLLTLCHSTIWNNYLSQLPVKQQDIYFSAEYYNIHEKKGDGLARCFVFEHDGNIAMYPFLINKINDLGYDLSSDYYDIQGAYGYNGVITSSYDNSFLSGFFDVFDQFVLEQQVVCEFVRFHPLLVNHEIHKRFLEVSFDRSTVCLDLSLGYETIFKSSYSSQNRNMIRKAYKNEVDYVISNDLDSYQVFKQLYDSSMLRLGADSEYLFPNDYFTGFYNELKDNSFVIVISKDDIPMAGALFLIKGVYCHYHLSGRSGLCNDNSLTNYILDIAVKEAINRGAKLFHFGGGRSNQPDDSLLRFKRNFSINLCDFFIGRKIHLPIVYSEIVTQWIKTYPQMATKYSNRLQCYRVQNLNN